MSGVATRTITKFVCTLFPGGEFGGLVRGVAKAGATRSARAAASLDAEALDLLVERRKRNLKALGGFGLVPVGALEHVDDDAPLDFLEYLEQRRRRSRAARADFSRQRRKEFGEL